VAAKKAITDYAGAGTRLAPEKAFALDTKVWAVQRKVDGAYVKIETDHAGVIQRMQYRSGENVGVADADGLYGMAIGLPSSQLHGEILAMTEWALAERQRIGYTQVHLFDVSRIGPRPVAPLPYSERYGMLHRWQAGVENLGDVPRLDWWNEISGHAHDPITGRFVRAVPRDLRRLPIVELVRGKGAVETLWSAHVEGEGGEGIVAVRLDAPLGARNAKRKIKKAESLDCVVVATGTRAAELIHDGHRFVVSAVGKDLRPGMTVEVLADGFYADGRTPRFPRIQRARLDLTSVADFVN
jgi:hypothetical protein